MFVFFDRRKLPSDNRKLLTYMKRFKLSSLLENESFSCFFSGKRSTTFQSKNYFIFYKGTPQRSEKFLQKIEHIFLESSEDQIKEKLYQELTGSYLLFTLNKLTGQRDVYRDAWGSIPLYYSEEFGMLSTDITALICGVPKKTLNKKALGEYLSCSYIVGKRTLIHEIKALCPLESLHVTDTTTKCQNFHQYPAMDQTINEEILIKGIEKHLDEYVQDFFATLKPEEACGVSLSGGTDSSLLVSKYVNQGKNKLICASVDYENWSRNDTPYFNHVIDKFSLDKKICTLNNERYAHSFEKLISSTSYPYHTFSAAGFALCRDFNQAYPDVKYFINGTGPDEAVIGFETFSYDEMCSYEKTPQSEWVKVLMSDFDNYYTSPELSAKMVGLQDGNEFKSERLALAQYLAKDAKSFTEFQRRYAKETITDHHIRMLHHLALHNNLEIIYPYCSQDLFELCFKASYHVINNKRSYKDIFKQILVKYYDEDFAYRPKIGFHAPSRKYFKENIGMGKLLSEIDINKYSNIIDIDLLKREIDLRLYDEKAPMDYLLWTTLNTFKFIELCEL